MTNAIRGLGAWRKSEDAAVLMKLCLICAFAAALFVFDLRL